MKKLYAPWRSDYSKTVAGPAKPISKTDCIFCQQFEAHNDDHFFILSRQPNIIIMLNLYPYNAGHLLLLPLEHHARLEDLSSEIRSELMENISTSLTILEKEFGCEGANVGLNLGKAGGAGLPSHLHFHIVPRWLGDTNFLPATADIKTISFDMKEIFNRLKPHFNSRF